MDTLYNGFYSTLDYYGLEISSVTRFEYSSKWDITRVVFDMDRCPNIKQRVHGAKYFETAFAGNIVEPLEILLEIYDTKLGQLL